MVLHTTILKQITRLSLCMLVLALTAVSCADTDTPTVPVPAAPTEAPPPAEAVIPDAAPPGTVVEDTAETPTTTVTQQAEVVSIADVVVVVDEDLIPAPEVVEEVFEVVEEAAPDSELTLQDCTDWVNAGFGDALNDEQQAQCLAQISATVETCQELECFPPTPAAETPTTTAAPTTTQPPTTTAAPTPAAETPTTTAAPTTTQPPTTTAAPTTTQPPTTTAAPAVEASYSAGRSAGNAPEGGHPPAPTIGMIPRELPYWDHPNCASSVDLICYPPSEWELPPDLDGCEFPSLDGKVCPGRLPDETPRQTVDTIRWTNGCNDKLSTPLCDQMLSKMKWALDFLGAHPWCVINEYTDKVNAHTTGQAPPRDINDRHGWHRCATVIDPIDPIVGTPDPGRDNDAGVLLSHSGISLAEQCRRVLPADVQLESKVRRGSEEVQRFGSDCDAWAAWIDDRIGADAFRVCDRSARLAEEWMEHHYLIPEQYHTVTC